MTELLAPAGNLEKGLLAFRYGADAVYAAGQNFGLRSGADNFTQHELAELTATAHKLGKRVYVVLNAFLHDEDMQSLPAFLGFLSEIGVDALIGADLGVITQAITQTAIPVHLSTQASVITLKSALLWREVGVKRIVLGREVSLHDADLIRQESGLEVEMFVQGAMCMSYSGHCTISNYTAGRDSNRGGCIQSCRHLYRLESGGQSYEKHFMSSKDLMAIEHLEALTSLGIDSLKIEGRMKNKLYLANSVRAYASCLASLRSGESIDLDYWRDQLSRMKHRGYTDGSFLAPAGQDSIYRPQEESVNPYEIAGTILEVDAEEGLMYYMVLNKTMPSDRLEFLTFGAETFCVELAELITLEKSSIRQAQPGTILVLPAHPKACAEMVARFDPRESCSSLLQHLPKTA